MLALELTHAMVYSRQRLQNISDDQSRSFKDLDGKVQSLVNAVTQGQQNFSVICDLINAQGSSTKQHISNEFEWQRRQLVAEDFRRRILNSLYFPEINVRQEDIKEAHKKTFEWIYDKTGADLRPWSIFTQWLEQGRATYWICGKAGSGKSTLMNTIHQDERTTSALKVWAGAAELLTPTFFFWNTGTELQKGSIGLLRSLLYQLISAVPVMTEDFLSAIDSIGQHATQQLPVWTEQRLCNWLVRLIETELSASRLCIFIDGLDEFTGDQDALIRLIMKLIQFPNTKICLSSRLHLRYADHFGWSAMLRLQDLTVSDIEHYVYDRLASTALRYPKALQIPGWPQSLASQIIKRAEGVFLWVALAINDQLEGIYNDDSPQLLQERLESFPSELEGVYTLMINRIDRVYRTECALYLRMAIDIDYLEICDLALAVYKGTDDILVRFPNPPAIEYEELCQSTSRRITAICKGFLEIKYNNITPFARRRVVFVHRTAADFVQHDLVGIELLDLQSPVDAQELYIKVRLVSLIIRQLTNYDFTVRENYDPNFEHLALKRKDGYLGSEAVKILDALSRCQEATGKTYSAWAEKLDQVVSSPSRCYPSPPTDQRWSQTLSITRLWWYNNVFIIRSDGERLFNFPNDFLGQAANSGLGLYVVQKLNSSVALQNQQYKDYLLGCIIFFQGENGWDVQHLKLMSALLEQGASPNHEIGRITAQRIGGITAWVGFLMVLEWSIDLIKLRLCESTWRGDFCDVLLGFLENGADIQTGVPTTSTTPIDNLVMKPFFPHFLDVRFQLFLSPLAIVRYCLGPGDEFSSVEKALTARQAPDRVVCSTMTFFPVRDDHSQSYSYGLSARQCDRLFGAWVQWRTDRDAESMVLEDEIDDIYMELRDEEVKQAARQQQELQEEDNRSESDSSESEPSEEGSFHSANS